MDIQAISAIAGALFTGLSILVGLGIVIFRIGHATAEAQTSRQVFGKKLDNMTQTTNDKLDAISTDIKRINGSVADVVKTANRNAQRLSRIEGAHEHLKP